MRWWRCGGAGDLTGTHVVRAVADVSAVIALGLVVVPVLDAPRYRAELAGRAARPLVAVSAAGVVAELVRLFLGASEAAGRPTDASASP